jgi:hypothetical protein
MRVRVGLRRATYRPGKLIAKLPLACLELRLRTSLLCELSNAHKSAVEGPFRQPSSGPRPDATNCFVSGVVNQRGVGQGARRQAGTF